MTAAQFKVLVKLLAEIRDLLTPPPEPEPIVAPEGCQHPEESRIDLSTPGDGNHWVCGVCRVDNKGVVNG